MSSKKEIQMWIDNLTNSIINTISGDSLPTEVTEVKSSDLKMITKTSGWNFNWKAEAKLADSIVYKLTILNNAEIIQGLFSVQDKGDHIFVNLVENAPFNVGKNKLYISVPGNLFAFACKKSWITETKALYHLSPRQNLWNTTTKQLEQ